MPGSKRTSTQRHQSDRDAQRGLYEAMMALVAMANAEEDCFCQPCRRLRDLAETLEVKKAQAGMPGALRNPPPAPPMRPRRDRP